MNIVFLDYDGVVNTPMWNKDGTRCRFNFPSDNMVNNFQCVQWVSEFCEKHNCSIVVTSTWRLDDNYKECLINGGLRSGVKIVGATPFLHHKDRCEEIHAWLNEHPEVEKFIIFDDDDSGMGDLTDHLVLCNTWRGFGLSEFHEAELLLRRRFTKDYKKRSFDYGISNNMGCFVLR